MAVDNEPRAYMHPPRRARRGHARNALIVWLDEQERLIRRRGIANEVVEEFDPLHNLPQDQEAEQGRRTLLFRFQANLESSIADQIHNMIVANVKSRFMLRLSAVVRLRHNIEDGRTMTSYQDFGTSRWFETLAASQEWVRQQEELRLETRRRPNTQWSYEKTELVYGKVILGRHPLYLGVGRLPDWLRNKRSVLSLDTYRDNRCLFRCIAVHSSP